MEESVKILIGADIVPTVDNYEYFVSENVEELVGEKVLEIIEESDYRIFNLEAPLTDKVSPIKKSGPNLMASTDTVHGLKGLEIDLLTLANNHIRDQGDSGIDSTVRTLENANIEYLGAGRSLEEVIKCKIIEIKNIKVGIYACAEHEYSIANEKHGGANPFDFIETFNDITKLKKECDYVIVLFHGGTELYRYPTPVIQKISRHMVDSGADIILLQHTHCIGAFEEYNSGTIVYGQGNFIFNNSDSPISKTSLLVQVELSKRKDKKSIVKFFPLEKTIGGVRLAEGKNGEEILSAFKKRSDEIKDINVLNRKLSDFSKDKIKEIKYILGGRFTNNRLFRLIDKWSSGKLIDLLYTEGHLLFIKDLFMCESYCELMSTNIIEED